MELKKCPFCGGDARIKKTKHVNADDCRYYVVCMSCAAEGGWAKSNGGAIVFWNMRVYKLDTQQEAIEAWNRRVK